MKIKAHKLKAKGWSEEEIIHAQKVLEKAEENKHPTLFFLEKALFWGLLFIAVVAIFSISLYVLPLLFVFNTLTNSLILLILGVCLGSLIAILLRDMDHLGLQHHILTIILLPLVAITNFLFVITKVDKLLSSKEAIILGIVFSLGIIIPYLFTIIMEKK